MERLPRWPPNINPVTVVIAVVIVAAVIIGYLVATLPPALVPPNVVQAGDTVSVNYIGFFDDGRVFDTSIQAVAEDNATYPKAVSFQPRRTYTPLSFPVGGPSSTVIEGFEQGVLLPTPMRVGEVREVTVPPEIGYGPTDPTKVDMRPLRVELTQFESLLRTEFEDQFQREPVAGRTFKHPVWEWNTTIVEASGDFVTLMHVPEVGMTLRPSFVAWDVQVVDVDTSANGGLGRIVVLHLLTPSDIDNVQATDERGDFRVVDLDPVAETYTADYNQEVVGQTLTFRIELVDISRP